MSLIAALCIDVGASIAKTILRIWFKDLDLGLDTSSATIIDILKEKTEDRVAQHRAQRQLEMIGEKVGESLLPLFEAESRLSQESRTAVALAVAETLNSISHQLLIQTTLEPSWLARHLLRVYPATRYHFNEVETQLYQRTVSEACEYIVDIAAQLPPFQRDTLTEVLRREEQIFTLANQILQEVNRMRKVLDPQAKEAQEAARFELEYRRAVVRHLDVLQLFGADVSVANRRHRLSVAYVMLSVEQKAWEALQPLPSPPDEALDQSDDDFSTLTTLQQFPHSPDEAIIQSAANSALTVDEALARSHYLLIQGLAGSGKTTLLQWIAVNAASQSFQGPLASWNTALPFYIRLRSCIQSGLPAPEDFPKSVAATIAHTMPTGWVHARLASGNAIVLIDGIDEIPVMQREEVRIWLRDLIETYPGARFIVTSRPHAVEKGWIDGTTFKRAELLPMELPDIYTFIDHWHAAVDEVVTDEYEKAELPLLAKALKDEIQRSRAKRNLATSPLLCAMLCSLNRERRRQLPSDRIELYEAFCQMLIERRDKERRVVLTDYPAATLSYRHKRMLLEDFAYWLLKNGWQEVEVTRADERFTHKLNGMYGIAPEISGIDARRLFLERAGIVRETAFHHLDFTHRTFQEFLAARAALDEGDIGVLIEHAHNDQWWEVIILASGLATRHAREELLLGLIERGDAEAERRHQLHMLAVSCLETSIEIGPVVKQDIEQCLGELVPPKNMADARALATAGELAVPHLTYRAHYEPTTLAACIFALAHIGSDTALDVLANYTSDDRDEVIDELLQAWNFFDRKLYAQRVVSNLLKNPEAISRHLTSLEGVQHLTDITALQLSECWQIEDLTPLAHLTQLTHLSLAGCWKVKDLTPLARLTRLTFLDLEGCVNLCDLSPLRRLVHLTDLNLAECVNISDIAPLADLTNLAHLDLTRCEQLQDITALGQLKHLTSLSLSGCWQIGDLAPIAGLTQLTSLDLARFWQISDLRPLSHLRQLTLLNLSYCERVKDLSPLEDLPNLKRLELYGIPSWIPIPQEMRRRIKIYQ